MGEQRDGAIVERHVDMLAFAGPRAHRERSLDRDGRVEPAEQVRDRHAVLHRLALGLAGQRHEPAHRLDDEVVARLVAARPVLPEAGDRAVYKSGIGGGQARVVEAELGQLARQEIFQHHVCLRRQIAYLRKIIRVAKVGGDPALPPIAAMIIGRLARAVLAVLALTVRSRRRSERPRASDVVPQRAPRIHTPPTRRLPSRETRSRVPSSTRSSRRRSRARAEASPPRAPASRRRRRRARARALTLADGERRNERWEEDAAVT